MTKKPRHASLDAPQPAPFARIVLVCSKCMRKRDREDLRGDLRKALKQVGRKDVRVVVSGCLDLCPDDGITVARGHDLGADPARLHVFDADGDIDDLARWAVQPPS